MAEARATDLSPRETPGASTSAVKAMQAEGRYPEARESYADLVGRHQRRASQIAFHYLRDDAAADEAVQDAFVEAYAYLASLPEELPFELWLNRILINGCLDRLKARTPRWLSTAQPSPGHSVFTKRAAGNLPSLEEEVLARERPQRVCGAVARLPARQRLIFMLSHYQGYASHEVSALTRLGESTVRKHLFRAALRIVRRVSGPGRGRTSVWLPRWRPGRR
jgi:RNA polymerase sigma-70 factor, ECF subfamily